MNMTMTGTITVSGAPVVAIGIVTGLEPTNAGYTRVTPSRAVARTRL